MHNKILLLGIFLFLFSCKSSDEKNIFVTADCYAHVFPLKIENYFYKDSFNFSFNNFEADSFAKNYMSTYLFNLKEPVLRNDTGCNSIRMLWVRSFQNPVVVRLNQYGNDAVVVLKELEKKFYNETSVNYHTKTDTIFLQKNGWKEVNQLLEIHKYWSANSNDTSYLGMKDGTHYILEALINGRYQCIERTAFYRKENPMAAYFYDIGNKVIAMAERGTTDW